MAELYTSEEICEALVRHTEVSGSEVFEKNFEKFIDRGGGENVQQTVCSVWCIIGENAQGFRDMARKWLVENGFKED